MASREMKAVLAVEGGAEFKQQMTDAANAIRVLNSAQELSDAQFAASGDAAQHYSETIEILKQKIEEQKSAVDAAQQAVSQLTANGFTANSPEMEVWVTKLNKAQTGLTEMQTALAEAETGLANVGTEAGTAGDNVDSMNSNLENIGKNVSVESVLSALEKIENGLSNIISKAASAAKALYEVGRDSGKWADELITQSSQYGLDTTTIQQMRYASRFIDTEASTIEDTMFRLSGRMYDANNGSTAMAQAFEDAGISITDMNGDLRSNQEVFWEIIDAMHNSTNEAERNGIAMKLLGRSAKEFGPLIEAGSEAYKDMMGTAPVVSEESVAALGQMDDAFQDLEGKAETLRLELMAQLAPAFTQMAEALSSGIDKLKDYMDTEEGRQAMENLGNAFQNVIQAFTSEENIETAFDVAVKAVNGLSKALQWVSKNGETVAGIIEGIAGAFAAIKVSQGVLTFMQLAKGFKGLFGGGNIPTTTTSGGGAVAQTAAKVLPSLTPAAIGAAYLGVLTAPVWGTALAENRDYGGYKRELGQSEQTMQLVGDDDVQRMQQIYGQLMDMSNAGILDEDDVNTIIRYREEVEKLTGLDFSDKLDSITDYFNENGLDAMTEPDFESALSSMVEGLGISIREKGTEAADEFAAGMNESGAPAEAAAQMAQTAADSAATLGDQAGAAVENGVSGHGETAGQMVGEGVAAGITSSQAVAEAAAANLANAVMATVNGILQIHSPSKVMEGVGGFIGKGLAIGMDESLREVEGAAARMSRAATAEPMYGAGGRGASQGGGGASAQGSGPVIVMDRQIVGTLVSPVVDGEIYRAGLRQR